MSEEITKELRKLLLEKDAQVSQKDRKIGELETQLEAYKHTHEKLLLKGFIDDVEALYDSRYNEANPKPIFKNFPSDPKAQRIRQRVEKWIWFLDYLPNEPKLIDIWRALNAAFRTQENIPAQRLLVCYETNRLNDFKRSVCHAVGDIHEIYNFKDHTAVQSFMRDLNNINIYGSQGVYTKLLLKALESVVQ